MLRGTVNYRGWSERDSPLDVLGSNIFYRGRFLSKLTKKEARRRTVSGWFVEFNEAEK